MGCKQIIERHIGALIILVFMFPAIALGAQAQWIWGYVTSDGPATWGKHYVACKPGGFQSPIDIRGAVDDSKKLPKLNVKLPSQPNALLNNGHTLEDVFKQSDDTLTFDNVTYKLLQFHFHSPSENTLNGTRFPMELHFVFENAQHKMIVLAVFIKKGQMNEAIKQLWKKLPTKHHQLALKHAKISLQSLLPRDRSYYTFEGSFTTPPCTRHVEWIVLKNPITISTAQLKHFRKNYYGNTRPIQKLDGRVIEYKQSSK